MPNDLFIEYEEQRENDPIAASELMVPMRWGQYYMLVQKGLIKPGDRSLPPVVMSEYTSELGLTFEKKLKDDEFD